MRRIMVGLLSAILMIAAGVSAADEAASAKPQAGKSIALVRWVPLIQR